MGRKPISMYNCKFISSCTIMYVCSYDLHYNVLWGQYASELNKEIAIQYTSLEERFPPEICTETGLPLGKYNEVSFISCKTDIIISLHACIYIHYNAGAGYKEVTLKTMATMDLQLSTVYMYEIQVKQQILHLLHEEA